MKKILFFALFVVGFSSVAKAQIFVNGVNLTDEARIKYVEIQVEPIALNNYFFVNASFGQRMRALNVDTRRLKDKNGNIEVYGVAEVFNLLDDNGFDFLTTQITGNGNSINTTYIFKRRAANK